MLIYRFINKINGKVYIGQTVKRLPQRHQLHRWAVANRPKQAFHIAVRKYGWEAFQLDVLYQAKSIEELNAMETFFIILHQSFRPEHGYNRNLGGYKRKNMGQVPWNKGKRGSQVAWNKGLKMSDDFRQKCRETHDLQTLVKGREKAWTVPKTPERIAVMKAQTGDKNPFFGRKHTPETRAKMRQAKLDRIASDPTYKASLLSRLGTLRPKV